MAMLRAQNYKILMYFHMVNSKIIIRITDWLLFRRLSEILSYIIYSLHIQFDKYLYLDESTPVNYQNFILFLMLLMECF